MSRFNRITPNISLAISTRTMTAEMIDTDFLAASAIRNYMDLYPEHANAFLDEKDDGEHASPSASSQPALCRRSRFAVRRTSGWNSGQPGYKGLIYFPAKPPLAQA